MFQNFMFLKLGYETMFSRFFLFNMQKLNCGFIEDINILVYFRQTSLWIITY